MIKHSSEIFMIQDIDKNNRIITLYDPVFDRTIKHKSNDLDEIEIYNSIFNDCSEINILLSVEYDRITHEILLA